MTTEREWIDEMPVVSCRLRRLIALACAALIAGILVAQSGPVVVSWAPVTHNTDGSPAVDLLTYTVHRKSGASWTKLAEVPASVTRAIVSLPAGTNLVRVTVSNKFGESNSSTTNVIIPVPRAVSGIEGSEPQ